MLCIQVYCKFHVNLRAVVNLLYVQNKSCDIDDHIDEYGDSFDGSRDPLTADHRRRLLLLSCFLCVCVCVCQIDT